MQHDKLNERTSDETSDRASGEVSNASAERFGEGSEGFITASYCSSNGKCSKRASTVNNNAVAGAMSEPEFAETSSENEYPTFTVDKIVGHQEKNGVVTYKVHWEGFASNHDTYELPEMFLDVTPVSDYLWKKINSLKERIKNLKAN